MSSFRSEPFLWIHLAGIAVVPISLQLVWVGFAVGTPWPGLGFLLELLIVGIVGIIPILWMQWTRPFDIFSILFLALKPESLSLNQQKILSLFKRKSQQVLAFLTALLMAGILWLIYDWAPLAAIVAAQLPQWRLLGLLIASLGFLMSNLFIQVPVSVLGILLTSDAKFESISPVQPEQIRRNFTIIGFKVQKILST